MLVGFDSCSAGIKRVFLNPASVVSVHDDARVTGTSTVTLTDGRVVLVKGTSDAVAGAVNEAHRASKRGRHRRHRPEPTEVPSESQNDQTLRTRALRAATVKIVSAQRAARRERVMAVAASAPDPADVPSGQSASDRWADDGGR